MRGYKVQAIEKQKSLPRQLVELAPQLIAPIAALAILIALSTGWIKTPGTSMTQMPTGGPTVPSGMAYADGKEIRFIHTEVSDPKVAELLTKMMNSPVLAVPSLKQAPQAMLADVYVFTNGVKGMGPLGFQPDVFGNPPGTEGYTPLRSLTLVTWQDAQAARELKSVDEIKAAESKGQVKIERPGVVINMPWITWPGGQR